MALGDHLNITHAKEPFQPSAVYLTKEQCARLAGIACDALVGIEIRSDSHSETVVYGQFIDVDNTHGSRSFAIAPDGSWMWVS